ncbi:hypothetical protein JCGZ_23511 [Jatropha curcas]|uniref:non-specific serine/threonine protein kinase n=1 Tax=Jatropha curcas TaxID=180498 RepID=A0A067JLI4_JATCU|nr:receptor-like protein kinase ANXUR2 [Jatropha curcas]KDP23678.1 hypothetical protein JCGZ_23511 [Jatropha curcas]
MYTNTHIFLFLAFFYVLHNVSIADTAQSFFLTCGTEKGGADADGQIWEPDTKYISGNHPNAKARTQDSTIASDIPFMVARIFTSEATYKLPVKPKTRYFLRLYFYPAEYNTFNIQNSYFSAVAEGVTLLNNFSAPITAQALSYSYIIKEYSLSPIEANTLNITFKPSDKVKDSFAFINGIELVPIQHDLFGPGQMVGFSGLIIDAKNADLETMYRLNVGGQYIAPSKDSAGLSRTWYDDSPYIFSAAMGITSEANKSVEIHYAHLPEEAAPAVVYTTARSMGLDSNINLNFNLTWLFQVDPGFIYIVRLHFCEFELTRVNQRSFNIYLNNQSAQADPSPADILGWTGGHVGQPTYKDYMVLVPDLKEDGHIQLDLHPSELQKPEIYDAWLNGLEIFKMSDKRNNLAGPNPELSEMLAHDLSEAKSGFDANSSHKVVIESAAGGAAGVCLVAAIYVAVYKRQNKVSATQQHTSSWLPIKINTSHTNTTSKTSTTTNSNLSSITQGLCRHFSVLDMKKATEDFQERNVIGVGGFGKVYKGVIDKNMKVAIKKSNPQSEQGVNEFRTEIEMLSKLRHKHLVSLIGFCEENEEMCLVYDYMELGTLREHLYNTNRPKLSWKQRLEICIGAARGLHYLHTGAKYTIIHRDVKTTNILLNENWVAKVSDFGLCKTGPNLDKGHVSTVVKGSFGYLDPEYFRTQQLTEKSDVFSFGVVLFEVLCARPPLDSSLPKEQLSLADWARQCEKRGVVESIIDPYIKPKIKPQCLEKFVETAVKCLDDESINRPSMGDVLWNLEFALQLQENSKVDHHQQTISSGGSSEIFPHIVIQEGR